MCDEGVTRKALTHHSEAIGNEKKKKTQQNTEPTKGIHHLQLSSWTKCAWVCMCDCVCFFQCKHRKHTRVQQTCHKELEREFQSLLCIPLQELPSPLLSSPLLSFITSPSLSPAFLLSLCNRRLAHRSPRVLMWTFHNPAAWIFFFPPHLICRGMY